MVPPVTSTGFRPGELLSASIMPKMTLTEQIQNDLTDAMKARDEQRLSTLRMVKSALKNREVEKMAPLDDKESQQVLSMLINQRKDSVEQFLKGGRKELADKEAAEILLIEAYLPKAAAEAEIVAGSARCNLRNALPAHHERYGQRDESGDVELFSCRHPCGWQGGKRRRKAGTGSKVISARRRRSAAARLRLRTSEVSQSQR